MASVDKPGSDRVLIAAISSVVKVAMSSGVRAWIQLKLQGGDLRAGEGSDLVAVEVR